MKSISKVRSLLIWLVLLVVLSITIALTWLRWDSGLPRADWFSQRHGQIDSVIATESITADGQLLESVQLISDSGLQVSFRIVRKAEYDAPLPVLMILGGYRTGSDSVELFGIVGDKAIVGVEYPYNGPEKLKGMIAIAKAIPLARQAILDTTPAVLLILDWLADQPWVDKKGIIVVGASLGVPFAARAAALDERITAVMLVHGAANNRLWAQKQVARQVDTEFMHYPLATILDWLVYGPMLDTGKHIATVSPRPVLIIGARDDERIPTGQTELLFDVARDPKRLRWTEGRHVQTNRNEIVEELLRIAYDELPFLIGDE